MVAGEISLRPKMRVFPQHITKHCKWQKWIEKASVQNKKYSTSTVAQTVQCRQDEQIHCEQFFFLSLLLKTKLIHNNVMIH